MFQALVPATNTIAVAGLASAVVNPVGIKIGMTAAAISQLSMLGASATCPEAEIGPTPPPPPRDPRKGCTELLNGKGDLYIRNGTTVNNLVYNDITGYAIEYLGERPDIGAPQFTLLVQTYQGGPYLPDPVPLVVEPGNYLELQPELGAVCGQQANPVPDNPEVPPVEYIDQSTNCVYIVQHKGFIRETQDGPISPVFQIESKAAVRADGGRMGGCNLGPVIYTPGPNGPGGPGGPTIPPIPVPPNPPAPDGDGVPWWAAPLLAGSTAAALNLIGQGFERMFAATLPEGSFTLRAPCDVDEQGNPLTQVWEYPEQTWQERSLAHEITMLEALQTHLNWKTPTCDCEPSIPEGDFRTISFRSDETSPYGKSRLRKRFRYRSVSGNDLGAVVDHWKDFTFEGGPYRVRWTGKSWRSPEIWAASEAEGKRVIQHAAAEAGFDPLEDGRWSTRLTSSGRQGVPGTMRVDTTKGFYWITERDGSDARPIVALT